MKGHEYKESRIRSGGPVATEGVPSMARPTRPARMGMTGFDGEKGVGRVRCMANLAGVWSAGEVTT